MAIAVGIKPIGYGRLRLRRIANVRCRCPSLESFVQHVVESGSVVKDTPEILWDVGWADIKRTIEGWVTDLMRRPATKRPRRGPIR